MARPAPVATVARMTEATRTLRTIVAATILMLMPGTADASGGPMIGGPGCRQPMQEGFLLELVSLEVDGAAVDPVTTCGPKLSAAYPDNAEFLYCGVDQTRHSYAKR